MDLVIHEVSQLEDVDVTDRDRVVIGLTAAPVVEGHLAIILHLDGAVRRVGVELLEDPLDRRVTTSLVLLVPVSAVECRRSHEGRWGRPRAGLAQSAVTLARAPLLRVRLHALPPMTSGVAETRLEDLPDVHSRWHAKGVQDDVDRTAISQVRHVLDREDLADDTLVAVASSELVTLGNLPLLGHVDPDQCVDAGGELIAVLTREHLDVDDLPGLAMRDLE